MVRALAWMPAWFTSLPTTTVRGRVFVTGLGLFAIIALASGLNGPILVLATLLAFVVVSCWASGRNLAKLTIERSIPSCVQAGEAFSVHLRVANERRVSPAIAVRVRDALHPIGAGADAFPLLHIPPGESVTISFTARIRRRGAYRVTNAILLTRFPFGLFERRVLCRFPSEILVTPREIRPRVRLDPEPRARRLQADLRGGRNLGSEDFLGLREYRSGDNPRWIAWKATARQGCLMVREWDRPLRRRTAVLLDTDTSHLPSFARGPALERGVSLVAGLARHLRRDGLPTLFSAFEPDPLVIRNVETATGHRSLLESLAVLKAASGRPPEDLLEHLDRRFLLGASVILVTAAPEALLVESSRRIRSLGCRLRIVDCSPGRRPRLARLTPGIDRRRVRARGGHAV
jgi:uncharacterized protein (DUF58 family)